MFRMGLLTSTAMTAVALLLSGAPAQAQTRMHVADRDANGRFLCTYGQFLVSANSSGLDSSHFSRWEYVAVPITGHGQTVNRIRVIEAQSASTSNSGLTVGIYKNTQNGVPGKPIAIGTGTVGQTCGPVTISIAPTRLKRGTAYWIEETVVGGAYSPTKLLWEANPNTERKAYGRYHRFRYVSGSYYSYTSPWTQQTTGPYLTLKYVGGPG